MEIDIQARNFLLTDGLKRHVQRRVLFAVGRFKDKVHRVIVRLSDINGPRGGVDKRCQLLLRVDGMPDIVVADTEMDLYSAIDRAADRAGRTLGRYLRRARGVFAARALVRDEGNFA